MGVWPKQKVVPVLKKIDEKYTQSVYMCCVSPFFLLGAEDNEVTIVEWDSNNISGLLYVMWVDNITYVPSVLNVFI